MQWRHRPTHPVDPETGQGFAHVQYAFAAHRAVVDVDTDLGLVKVVALDCAQDVGLAINPQAVVGQIQGGSAQGLGLAIMEEIQVRDGMIRNPSFTDYLIPTILDVPPMRIDVLEYPDPHAPYGVRGVGEPPTISSGPAIVAAIRAATGLDLARVPVKPEAYNGNTLVTRPFGADVLAYRLQRARPAARGARTPSSTSAYPGDCLGRQPVHTAYVPAPAFRARRGRLWGAQAIAALEEFAPGPGEFAAAMGLAPEIAAQVRPLVLAKLAAEPIEDLRIDFEDGYGTRAERHRGCRCPRGGPVADGPRSARTRRRRFPACGARAWRRRPGSARSGR